MKSTKKTKKHAEPNLLVNEFKLCFVLIMHLFFKLAQTNLQTEHRVHRQYTEGLEVG